MAKRRQQHDELLSAERGQPEDTRAWLPRTGVGSVDTSAEAGGAELGGDTGDIGDPYDEIGDSPGGTRGASNIPEASTVVTPGAGKGMARDIRRAA